MQKLITNMMTRSSQPVLFYTYNRRIKKTRRQNIARDAPTCTVLVPTSVSSITIDTR